MKKKMKIFTLASLLTFASLSSCSKKDKVSSSVTTSISTSTSSTDSSTSSSYVPTKLDEIVSFKEENDGTVSISKLLYKEVKTLVVPETYNNKTISSVETNVFEDSSIESITFEGSTALKNYSFSNCKNLKEIKFLKTDNVFYSYVFDGCTSLEEIVLPEEGDITDSHYLFNDCTSLKRVKLPKTYNTFLETDIFRNCTNLDEVTFHEGNIKYKAGNHCITNIEGTDLYFGYKNLDIPTTVTRIVTGAFIYNNLNLSDDLEYTIPSHVKTVDALAYRGLTLKSFTVPSTVTTFQEFNMSYSNIGKVVLHNTTFFQSSFNQSHIDYLFIGKEVKNRDDAKEANLSYIKDIVVDPNNTVYYTSNNFLMMNQGEKKLVMAPYGQLEVYNIPYGATNLHMNLFCGNEYVRKVTMPDTIIRFDGSSSNNSNLFYNCPNLEELNLSEGLVTSSSTNNLYKNAIVNCPKLKLLNIPQKVTELINVLGTNTGFANLTGCTGIEKITVTSGNTSYSVSKNCLIQNGKIVFVANKFSVPTGITQLDYLVQGKTLTNTFTVPSTVTSIFSKTFYEVKEVETINIEGDIAIFYADTFKSDTLKNVTIKSISNLNKGAFIDCQNLENVNIKMTLDEFKASMKKGNLKNIKEAFKNCPKLKGIKLADETKSFFEFYDLDSISVEESN